MCVPQNFIFNHDVSTGISWTTAKDATGHRQGDNPSGGAGVSGAERGTVCFRRDYRSPIGRCDRQFYYYTKAENIKHFSKLVHRANAFRTNSCSSSFTMKSCAYSSIAFLSRDHILVCGQYSCTQIYTVATLTEYRTLIVGVENESTIIKYWYRYSTFHAHGNFIRMFFLGIHFLLINNAFLGALFSQLLPCGCSKSFLAIPGSHERDKQHFLDPPPHSPACSVGS